MAMYNYQTMCPHFFHQRSISQPGKTGTPNFDLSKDSEANVANSFSFISAQLAHERVVTKVFAHHLK